MNHPEHARTGTSAVGRWIQTAISLRRGDGRSLTPAPAKLVIVDVVAQHDEQPHEELAGDRDFGLGASAAMHEGEVGPLEVGIQAGGMRRGLPEGEAEQWAALLGDVAEMIFYQRETVLMTSVSAPLPRICSLLPSATEIVFALGVGGRLVAVTHECDFPPEATRLPIITRSTLDHHGTRRSRDIHTHISTALHGGSSIYLLDQDLLQRLAPDLILTQELCDVCAVSYETVDQAVRRLHGRATILSLEPTTLHGVLDTIRQVGEATGTGEHAATLVRELEEQIGVVATRSRSAPGRRRVFAMEWLDPPFTAGHWVPQLVRLAGGQDELAREGFPSAQIPWGRIADYDPEIIILMPCGFTMERTLEEFAHISLPREWSRLSAVRSGQVYAVNGSAYFNRPGPRVVVGLQILAEIIHPEIFSRTTPPEAWQRLTE